MGQFIGGFATATVLAAVGGVLYFGYLQGADDAATPCGGVCGDGTVCSEDRCEIAPPEVDTPPEDDGKKKRRRRGRRGRKGASEQALAAGFVPVDDSSVPRFNPKAEQSMDMDSGTGRLSDRQVDQELAKLDGTFQGCVKTAAKYADELGTGTVKMNFGVDGKGKVTGVNVRAPENLAAWGIVPCVRKAVYGHRFPAFDGPIMRVESSFRVD